MKRIFWTTLILCLAMPLSIYAINGSDFDVDKDGDVDGEDLAGFVEYYGTLRWYKDFDGDKHSDGTTLYASSQPPHYYPDTELISLDGDCDDMNPNINPGVEEACNDGVDNDCNVQVDEGCSCVTPDDCPVNPTPVCDSPNVCQGYRLEATCIDNECGAIQVDDDSACGQDIIANQCDYYQDVYCTGGEDQDVPVCPSSCVNNFDCDEEAFCLNDVCQPDLPPGYACIGDAQCATGYCVGGVCCDSICYGICLSWHAICMFSYGSNSWNNGKKANCQ